MEKIKRDIHTVEKPCLSLLRMVNLEKVEEIVSMTLKIRLTTKSQICPLDTMKRIIEDTVGIQPLNLSVISPTSVQILYKKGDSDSFQKLLIPGKIQLVEAKGDNFQPRDINRIAQLYLRGYFKELARAAIQDLPTPIVNSTTESSGYSEITIHDKNYAEEMAIQYTERQNSFSTSSYGDRQKQLLKDNKDKVTSPIDTHTCSICNKTVQSRYISRI
jgi:ribosomal protein L44E